MRRFLISGIIMMVIALGLLFMNPQKSFAEDVEPSFSVAQAFDTNLFMACGNCANHEQHFFIFSDSNKFTDNLIGSFGVKRIKSNYLFNTIYEINDNDSYKSYLLIYIYKGYDSMKPDYHMRC